jgi:hypothetical protein
LILNQKNSFYTNHLFLILKPSVNRRHKDLTSAIQINPIPKNMKLMKMILISALFYLLALGLAVAQEQVAIPLSRPGEAGFLEVELVRGSIDIRSYEGQEVIIRIRGHEEKADKQASKKGMHRITGPGFEMEAEEDDNEVRIDVGPPNRDTNLEILLPANFSVNAATVNNGNISVRGLRGEMEISNVNGGIRLEDISGSAVASTVNGHVHVTFNEVSPDAPMAFSSLNGDIDVTFPYGVQMDAQMKTLNGEIYTDFDMDIGTDSRVDKKRENGVYRVSIDKSISGTINGGGPKVIFKNHNGDIYIRKR